MLNTKHLSIPRPLALDALPPFKILLALVAVYLIWGSTYLAVRISVISLPPFMMSSLRFFMAGGSMVLVLYWRGEALPTLKQWRNASVVGLLLMGCGQGGVAFAGQWVSSGLLALAGGSIPLWAALFASFWERKPTRMELVGLGLGIVGVAILNIGTDVWLEPQGAIALILSPMCWAFGSMWSRHNEMPRGLMAPAAMMLMGSLWMGVGAVLTGESLPAHAPAKALFAMFYLTIFGSIIAFTAYHYLLKHAQPVVATSYAYVNPVIAVVLGWLLLHESLSPQTALAAAFIVTAVLIVTTSKKPPR